MGSVEKPLVRDLLHRAFGEFFVVAEHPQRILYIRGGELQSHAFIISTIENVTVARREMLALLAAAPWARAAAGRPQVAITLDDMNVASIPEARRKGASRSLLDALRKHGNLHAALFVVGKNADSPEGHAVVEDWSASGHMIANHTWSHHTYNDSIAPADFGADLLRCDALLRPFAGFRPYFRFPMLKEGKTRERRDWMRAFLRDHGYRNGAVTIDASDWYYDQRLHAHLQSDVSRFREAYSEHIWNRATYYNDLALEVLGHPVRHTLLLHFNLLNTLFLGDLLHMFHTKGWQLIDAQTAFADKVFDRQPDIAPAGESLIWALAKETGRFDATLRYPGEDDTYEKPILDRLGL
jgi:peptidoglycan-N-acetylglucosamine deacetylase